MYRFKVSMAWGRTNPERFHTLSLEGSISFCRFRLLLAKISSSNISLSLKEAKNIFLKPLMPGEKQKNYRENNVTVQSVHYLAPTKFKVTLYIQSSFIYPFGSMCVLCCCSILCSYGLHPEYSQSWKTSSALVCLSMYRGIRIVEDGFRMQRKQWLQGMA